MKNLMDMHTHTIESVHAYSTLRENAIAAKERGLKILGTSDHGYGAENTARRVYFTNFHIIPKYIEGIRILKGIELNICDTQGNVYEQELIEWKNKYEEAFDYAVGSIHRNSYTKDSTEKENTRAYLNAIENPLINILGHIDDGGVPSNYDEIMHKASEFNVIVEVNNTSIKPENYRKNSIENIRKYLEYGKKYNTLIIMNTDAHIYTEVGDIKLAKELVESVGYDEDLIVNYHVDLLEEVIGKKDILG